MSSNSGTAVFVEAYAPCKKHAPNPCNCKKRRIGYYDSRQGKTVYSVRVRLVNFLKENIRI